MLPFARFFLERGVVISAISPLLYQHMYLTCRLFLTHRL